MPKSKDRDTKIEKALHDSCEGNDQGAFAAIYDAMGEKSGSLLSGIYKTKAFEKAADGYHEANRRLSEANDRIRKEARKRAFTFSQQMEAQKRLRANSPQWQEAKSAYDKSCNKLAITVLKDMDMPINENTINYIQYFIFYD